MDDSKINTFSKKNSQKVNKNSNRAKRINDIYYEYIKNIYQF